MRIMLIAALALLVTACQCNNTSSFIGVVLCNNDDKTYEHKQPEEKHEHDSNK